MADRIRRIDVYPDDWLAGTYQLSLEEEGAYWRICCLIYSKAGPIDDDDRMMAANLRTSQRRWRAIKNHLVELGKITISGGKITNKRAENELKAARKRFEDASSRGKSGANKRWGKGQTGKGKSNENKGYGDSASNEASNGASNGASTNQPLARARVSTTLVGDRKTPKQGLSESPTAATAIGVAALASPSGDGSLRDEDDLLENLLGGNVNGVSPEHLQMWRTVRAGLEADIGSAQFKSWFSYATVNKVDVQKIGPNECWVIELGFPTQGNADWVASHYADVMGREWRSALGDDKTVKFKCSAVEG